MVIATPAPLSSAHGDTAHCVCFTAYPLFFKHFSKLFAAINCKIYAAVIFQRIDCLFALARVLIKAKRSVKPQGGMIGTGLFPAHGADLGGDKFAAAGIAHKLVPDQKLSAAGAAVWQKQIRQIHFDLTRFQSHHPPPRFP